MATLQHYPYFPPAPPHNPTFPWNNIVPPSPPKAAPPHPPVVTPPPPHVDPPPPHRISPPPPPPPHIPTRPPPPHVVPPLPHPISPPPLPHVPTRPPPPHVVPAPPHPISPPPPPRGPTRPPPPPPHVPSPPPPPRIVPPPPPPPAAPGHHTVIIFIFVSLGGLFFLAFLAVALFCFLNKRKKRIIQETDKVKFDEHIEVHEDIVPGPHGKKAIILTIDDDVDIKEEIRKTEVVGESLHVVKSTENHPQAMDMVSTTSDHHNHSHR